MGLKNSRRLHSFMKLHVRLCELPGFEHSGVLILRECGLGVTVAPHDFVASPTGHLWLQSALLVTYG